MDLYVDVYIGRLFGVDAVLKTILYEWDEKEGDDGMSYWRAFDREMDMTAAFESGLLQLDIVGKIVEFLIEGNFFATGVEQDIAHHGREPDDGVGGAVGPFEGHGIDAVQCIEEEVRVDLCFEVGQLGVELFRLGLFQPVADLDQEGEEEDEKKEGEVLADIPKDRGRMMGTMGAGTGCNKLVLRGWGLMAVEVGHEGDEQEQEEVGQYVGGVVTPEIQAGYEQIEIDVEGGEDQGIGDDVPLCGRVGEVRAEA